MIHAKSDGQKKIVIAKIKWTKIEFKAKSINQIKRDIE